ncbi:MAG TPA: GNAT family N-acetyltransferase [Geminicoccaceae bacterium]
MSSPERARAGAATLQVKLVQGIGQIDAQVWDACVGPDQPFLSHGFLSALEDSGSASQRTGWLPLHLVVETDGELIGCAPMYLKSHSYGEYVFDWGWANAYERAGGKYYPKLQVSVPFTPVPGPRLLIRPEIGAAARQMLAHGLVSAAEQLGVSSLHVTFCREDEWHKLGDAGLLKRQGVQYHWHNRGYRTFDDFLGALKSSKRKTIRKERARIKEQGLSIEVLTGAALTPDIWDVFYPFYLSTVDKRWGSAYLTRRFFARLGETMPERVVLMMARHQGRYVAGALNLLGADTLYGRVWGCRREFEFLHFEACYYQAIEFAIGRGLARVEAGAQGPHKLQRGYEPVATYSAHWIRDPGFRDAVERFLAQERREMVDEMGSLRVLLPYRQV